MHDPGLSYGPDMQALQREIVRLNKIVQALMDRAERSASVQGTDFGLFQTAIMLEGQVRQRTAELEAALRENEKINHELRVLQEQLREQSVRDALTGLYNRRYLEETLERELILAKRNENPVSLIIGDLDHFKAINDNYGHLGGDEVLRSFGALLKRYSRGSDVYCRYGGEEFLLVLPNMPKEHAVVRAELLRSTLAATPVTFGATEIAVTASFGVAAYPQDGQTTDYAIAAADKALYAAKAAGRNRVEAYTGTVTR